jgi:hypothetical protein
VGENNDQNLVLAKRGFQNMFWLDKICKPNVDRGGERGVQTKAFLPARPHPAPSSMHRLPQTLAGHFSIYLLKTIALSHTAHKKESMAMERRNLRVVRVHGHGEELIIITESISIYGHGEKLASNCR